MYSHKFYLATISNFPKDMEKDSFEFDGRLYHWKSIAGLEQDKDVQRKNLDILNYVTEIILNLQVLLYKVGESFKFCVNRKN